MFVLSILINYVYSRHDYYQIINALIAYHLEDVLLLNADIG